MKNLVEHNVSFQCKNCDHIMIKNYHYHPYVTHKLIMVTQICPDCNTKNDISPMSLARLAAHQPENAIVKLHKSRV